MNPCSKHWTPEQCEIEGCSGSDPYKISDMKSQKQNEGFSITHYENEYHIFNKNAKTRGVYTKDGSLLRGDPVLSADEAKYRIWRQFQLPSLSENQLKKLYEVYLATTRK